MISNIQIKDIKGYEGLYAITSYGKIYSYTSKKFLKPIQQKNGYLRICLSKNNIRKNFLIHRLVIETYNPVDNFYGGIKGLQKQQLRDNQKREYCLSHNIPLYEISYKDNIISKLEECIYGNNETN